MTIRPPRPPPLKFDFQHVQAAFDAWGCNCGPGALAAVTGRTLDEVRPHVPGFEDKRYTNPSMMYAALDRLIGSHWRLQLPLKGWPSYGLARIQWEGPWSQPGVPKRVAYRHTHWVGVLSRSLADIEVFDINAMIPPANGWISLKEWSQALVPWLLGQTEPKATGDWHITHAIEILALEIPQGRPSAMTVGDPHAPHAPS